MEETTENNHQRISWWITSLAISITCCAVLFVIFAGFVSDLKKQLITMNEDMEQMVMHQDRLLTEMQLLQHSLPGVATTASSTTAAPAPAAITPPTGPLAPMSPTMEQSPVISTGTSAPTVVTPPAASPTAIPEVPASPPSK